MQNGKSIDTTMGLTPLEGLMMGTRCGEGWGLLRGKLRLMLPPVWVPPPLRPRPPAHPTPGSPPCAAPHPTPHTHHYHTPTPPTPPHHTHTHTHTTTPPTPGDIDPAITTYLASRGMSAKDIDTLMNKKSGFLGLAGEARVGSAGMPWVQRGWRR
jgi:hypothetical protein